MNSRKQKIDKMKLLIVAVFVLISTVLSAPQGVEFLNLDDQGDFNNFNNQFSSQNLISILRYVFDQSEDGYNFTLVPTKLDHRIVVECNFNLDSERKWKKINLKKLHQSLYVKMKKWEMREIGEICIR